MIISKLKVSGFRRLRDVRIELGPLCVLIGANGSGKSSVLDVLSLIAASAAKRMNETIMAMGGFSSVVTRDGFQIAFSLDFAESGATRFQYSFDILRAGVGYRLGSELLIESPSEPNAPQIPLMALHGEAGMESASGELQALKAPLIPGETALSQLPDVAKAASISGFRRSLASATLYRPPAVGTNAPIRLPQKVQPAIVPGPDAANLIPLLYTIRETDRARFDAIEDALRTAFPWFRRLELPPVGGGLLGLAWREANHAEPFFAQDLSDGQLRFLSLVTLLQSPEPPAVLLIDEPEESMHPELLALLADLLREASERTQIIVATHSDRLVRFLKPEEVVVSDLDESGMARFTRASEMDIDDWLEDYTLDQLWSKGRIGGRS